MKKITLKKMVATSAIIHAIGIIAFSISGDDVKTESPSNLPPARPPIMTTQAASQAEVDQILDQMRESEAEWDKTIAQRKSELKKVNANLKKAKDDSSKHRRELNKLDTAVKAKQKELDELKKNSELKAKREAEAKAAQLKKEKALKDQKEKELQLAKQKEAEIAKTKAENARRLAEIKAKAAREKEEAKIRLRSAYESAIKQTLFSNWTPPLRRMDIVCKVSLEVTPYGQILGFEYLTDCPEDYASTIRRAINRTGFINKPPKDVYKRFEEVNFVDSRN